MLRICLVKILKIFKKTVKIRKREILILMETESAFRKREILILMETESAFRKRNGIKCKYCYSSFEFPYYHAVCHISS